MTHWGNRVLLPVVSPESAPHLATVALGLVGGGGEVIAMSVVPPDADRATVADADRVLAAMEDLVDGTGVAIDTVVVAAESVARAVHDAALARNVDVVVMGWAGSGSSQSAFGSIVDHVVGRSRVPLLMVRPGRRLPTSVLLAFDTDQLHPSGRRGLVLAARVAAALRDRNGWPLTLLQTGMEDGPDLPPEVAELTDRIHHDPRRRHEALAAARHDDQLVVAPVAPTVAGLRSATSRINWAAGDATLAVAVDVGPIGSREDLTHATAPPLRAVPPAESAAEPRPARLHGIAVTATAEEPPDRQAVQQALAAVGEVSGIRTWWSGPDREPHLSLVVSVVAESDSLAIGRVLDVVDTLPALAGARVRYDLVEPPTPWRLRELTPLGLPDLLE